MSTQLKLAFEVAPCRKKKGRTGVVYGSYEFVFVKEILAWDVFKIEGKTRKRITALVSDKTTGKELYGAFIEQERE